MSQSKEEEAKGATPTEPTPPEEPTDENTTEEVVDWEDRYLRAAAELQNLRRRQLRDTEERARAMTEGILAELITGLDHLDLAIGSVPKKLQDDPEFAGFRVGIDAIHQELRRILEGRGVEPVAPDGDPLDATVHEVAEIEERDGLEEEFVQTLRPGFRWGQRILRPARVRVVRPPQRSQEPEEEDS